MAESYFNCKPLNGSSADYFKLRQKIGEGGFGKVYVALTQPKAKADIGEDLPDTVAIKQMRTAGEHESHKKLLKDEIRILKHIDTAHTIKYYGCYEDKHGNLYLVMDIAEGDNLYDGFFKRGVHIDQLHKDDMVKELAKAIKEIHDIGLVHRDLKMENIMVKLLPDHKTEVTLIDYGLSCYIPELVGTCSKANTVGTPGYIDRYVKGNDYDSMKLADWWAYGLICVEIYTGESLFDYGYGNDVIQKNLTPGQISKISPKYRDLLKQLTDHTIRPDQRPTPAKILEVILEQAPATPPAPPATPPAAPAAPDGPPPPVYNLWSDLFKK